MYQVNNFLIFYANLTMGTGTGTTAKISRFGRFFRPRSQRTTPNHPTTSGDAIQYFLADWEDNLDANHCIQQCYVFVWRPSTGAVVGVIQPVQTLCAGSQRTLCGKFHPIHSGFVFQWHAGVDQHSQRRHPCIRAVLDVHKGSNHGPQRAVLLWRRDRHYGRNTVVATPASKVVFSVDLPLEMPIARHRVSEVQGSRRAVAPGSYPIYDRGPDYFRPNW